MHWLLSGVGPLIAGAIAVIIWHQRRARKRYLRRRADYVWAFLNGGIAYVMAALLVVHYVGNLSYSQELTNGFGDTQVTVAFVAALFESVWSYMDMWHGVGLIPPAGG